MNRRDFLSALAAAGIVTTLPIAALQSGPTCTMSLDFFDHQNGGYIIVAVVKDVRGVTVTQKTIPRTAWLEMTARQCCEEFAHVERMARRRHEITDWAKIKGYRVA